MFPIRYFFFKLKKKLKKKEMEPETTLDLSTFSNMTCPHLDLGLHESKCCYCLLMHFFFPKRKQNKQKIITKRNIQKSHKIKRTKNQLKNSVVSFPRWSMNDRTSRYYFSLIIGGSSCELILKSRRISIVQYTIKYKFLLYYVCTQLICKE